VTTPIAYSEILTSIPTGGVGLIQLNRPEALNALNQRLEAEVFDAATSYDLDPEIGAIVISGSDRAFAAGADIREMAPRTSEEMDANPLFAGWDGLAQLRTPLIAAVSGYALGGGCELAMICDVVIAAENAVFGQPEVQLGIMPGFGGTQRLTRAIGKAKAMDLCLTGRTMDAREAEHAGLVSRVVPDERALAEALSAAQVIAGMSGSAAATVKAAVNAAFEGSLASGLQHERALFKARFGTADQKEGMAAFLEKRPPSFRR
jgi:enoyl-CoA hydratase